MIPNAKNRSWEIYALNEGDTKFGITHNIFPSRGAISDDPEVHDDHEQHGHGLPVEPGKVSSQIFRENDTYNDEPILEGSWCRFGIRGYATRLMKLPSFEGRPKVFRTDDMRWYHGSPSHAEDSTGEVYEGGSSAHCMETWNDVAARAKDISMHDSIETLRARLRGLEREKIDVKGRVVVTPILLDGRVERWTVRFENGGRQAFIGTVAFEQSRGKNAGKGLESMAVPFKNSAAEQDIFRGSDYGATAVPGARIRLGVRGYGCVTIPLPRKAEKCLDVSKFTGGTIKRSDDFFDTDAVAKKRLEKLLDVRFFQDGRAINDELCAPTLRGEEARGQADFDPPRVKVRRVRDSSVHPGGGFVIDVESSLPEKDELGSLHLPISFLLEETTLDQALPPFFLRGGETRSSFLPTAALGKGAIKTGDRLAVDTGPLGWTAVVPLPRAGVTVDTAADFDVWSFREDHAKRARLSP